MRKRHESIRGFAMPLDGGVTPLPLGEDHGLCAKCEGRPALFEMRLPDDPAPRRLCFECLFEELPGTDDGSEALEAERQQLADTERTASHEQLGHAVEFLERRWLAEPESAPDFVKEFIAKYRHLVPPPVTPVLVGSVGDGDMQAARLALLVMRGKLCEHRAVSAEHYLIEPSTSPVSRDAAAELLARMPKPLDCHARRAGDVMSVRCRLITDPSHLDSREQIAVYSANMGGSFPHLRREHGEGYLRLAIFCLGYEESLIVSAADVERWNRDYDVHPLGTNASPPRSYLATNPDGARAAAAAGAAYFMKCYFSPNDWAAEEEGRIIDVRDTTAWDNPIVYGLTSGLGVTCDHCVAQVATWWVTDTRSDPWQERRLCATCVARELAPHALDSAARFEEWVTGLSEKGRRSVSEDVADALDRMERWWRHLPPPPEVAAALARCRQL